MQNSLPLLLQCRGSSGAKPACISINQIVSLSVCSIQDRSYSSYLALSHGCIVWMRKSYELVTCTPGPHATCVVHGDRGRLGGLPLSYNLQKLFLLAVPNASVKCNLSRRCLAIMSPH